MTGVPAMVKNVQMPEFSVSNFVQLQKVYDSDTLQPMNNPAERLSGIDSLMFALDHPGPPPVISGAFEFDRRLDFSHINAFIADRLLRHDRFRMRPSINTGFPVWVEDPSVDMDYHLCRSTVAPPGGKKQVQALFTELSAEPLDPGKPLWRVHYIENTESKGSYLFFRVHHCIGDGISLVRLLLSITDTAVEAFENLPENDIPSQHAKRSKRKCHTVCDYAKKKIKTVISDPAQARQCAKNKRVALSEAAMTMARLLMLPPDRECFFNQPPTTLRRMAWTAPLPLDDIKKAGARFNATVNDVIAALATGGLRRYLDQNGMLQGKLPIRMAVPVNIRPREAAISAQADLKNAFGFVLAPLPVFIHDPLRRIRRVSAILDQLKQSSDASVAWAAMNALGAVPPEFARKTAHLFAEKITGIISNVPGPDRELYFAGGKLKRILFWLPLVKGMGIGISAFSYNNIVSLGIVTDAQMAPDPDAIARHIEAEFNMIAIQCKT